MFKLIRRYFVLRIQCPDYSRRLCLRLALVDCGIY